MVIAIIAVLVAVGVGGMFRYRKSADKAAVIGNMRSLQSANQMWASDHNGKYISIFAFDEDTKNKSEWWKTKEFLTNFTGDPDPDPNKPPLSTLDPSAVRSGGLNSDKMTANYGYVSSNMPGGSWGQANTDRGFRASQINNPARSAAFVSATDWILKYPGRLEWKVGETKDGYNSNGMIAFRHDGKAAVVYYDGHVGFVGPTDVKKFDAEGGDLKGEKNVFWNGAAP